MAIGAEASLLQEWSAVEETGLLGADRPLLVRISVYEEVDHPEEQSPFLYCIEIDSNAFWMWLS